MEIGGGEKGGWGEGEGWEWPGKVSWGDAGKLPPLLPCKEAPSTNSGSLHIARSPHGYLIVQLGPGFAAPHVHASTRSAGPSLDRPSYLPASRRPGFERKCRRRSTGQQQGTKGGCGPANRPLVDHQVTARRILRFGLHGISFVRASKESLRPAPIAPAVGCPGLGFDKYIYIYIYIYIYYACHSWDAKDCWLLQVSILGHALHEKTLQRQKQRSTGQRPGAKSAPRPGDKPVINRSSTARCVPPSVPGHALHEKGLQRQKNTGPLVSSQDKECFPFCL